MTPLARFDAAPGETPTAPARPLLAGLRLSRLAGGAVAAVLVAVTVAGCTGTPSGDPTDPSAPATSSSASATSSSTPEAVPSTVPTRSSAATPVPAPTGGDVSTSVSARPVEERSPVAIDAESKTTDEIAVKITSVRALDVVAQGPGEVSGPGVAVTVEVANGSDADVSLALASVSLTGSDGAPAAEMSGSPAAPLTGTVAAGADADGVYVFTLTEKQRSKVRFTLSLDPATPTAVFEGRVA